MGLPYGAYFDLDYHTNPYHGEDPIAEERWISRRSRRQRGIRAVLARDASDDGLCYFGTISRTIEIPYRDLGKVEKRRAGSSV